MTDKAKVFTIILIFLMAVSLGVSGMFFYSLQKEQTKNAALQHDLDDVSLRLKATEVKLEDSKRAIQAYEAKLKESSDQIDLLTKNLEQEKSSKEDALSQMQQVKADLDQQKNLRADLENKLTQAQETTKKMLAQLNSLETKKAELEVKIKDLEQKAQGVELGKIVVTPENAAVPVVKAQEKPPVKKQDAKKQDKISKKDKKEPVVIPPLEGKVLVVNKDYNFVVINLGSKDGVNIGDVFSISRNDNFIGDIKIEKVHDSMSAAGFLSDDAKALVNEGDKVVQKK